MIAHILRKVDRQLAKFVQAELRFEIQGDTKTKGFGDDGVLLVRGNTAIKIFVKDTSGSAESKYINRIRRDQAYREYKALSIISKHYHPNFPTIISTELDTCTATLEDARQISGWAVQMQYIQSVNVLTTSRLWGLVLDEEEDLCFDFEYRNQNLNDIIQQLTSAVEFMGNRGIQHRDLDLCNLLMRIDDFQLFVVDFARSDLPNGVEGFEDTDSPEELITKSSSTKYYGIQHNEITNGYLSLMRRIFSLYEQAYANNNGINNPSDLESIEIVLKKILLHHATNDFIFDSIEFDEHHENERIEYKILNSLPTQEYPKKIVFLKEIDKTTRIGMMAKLITKFTSKIYLKGDIIRQQTTKIIPAQWPSIRHRMQMKEDTAV